MSRKLCEICETRPVMSQASKLARGTSFPYCDPCQDKAEWENAHSDHNHDGDHDATPEKDACWICHPELDKTDADYTPRAGTSRAGMRMTVRRTLTGREKADMVASRVIRKYPIDAAKVSTRKGIVTLKVETKEAGFTLRWTVDGRYDYAASKMVADGKEHKVRNASEALRLLGL